MKKVIPLLTILTLVVLLGIFLFSPVIIRVLGVDTIIKNNIEEKLGRPISFDAIRISFIPSFSFEIMNLTIQEEKFFEGDVLLTAENISIGCKLLPLILRKIDIKSLILRGLKLKIREKYGKINVQSVFHDYVRNSSLTTFVPQTQSADMPKTVKEPPFSFFISKCIVKDSEISYETIDDTGVLLEGETLSDVNISAHNIAPNQPINFRFRTSLGGNVIKLDGTITSDFTKFLETLQLDTKLNVSIADFSFLEQEEIKNSPVTVSNGTIAIEGGFTFNNNIFSMKSKSYIQDLQFFPKGKPLLKNTPLSGSLKIDGAYDISQQNIVIDAGRLDVGRSSVIMDGTIDIKNERVSTTIQSSQCFFEELVLDMPFVKAISPKTLNIEGPFSFSMTGNGTFFKQNIKANFDFTKNKITREKCFTKPSGQMFFVSTDLNSDNANILNGVFDVRLANLSLKGDITNYDIEHNKGEINFLTNKFDLQEFATQVNVFSDYSIAGKSKILFNMRGNMLTPEGRTFNIGVTLDDLAFKGLYGLDVRNLNASFKIGHDKIVVDSVEGYCWDSYLKGWLSVENYVTKPDFNFELYSSELNVDTILDRLAQAAQKESDDATAPNAAGGSKQTARTTDSKASSSDKTGNTNDAIKNMLKTYNGEGAFYFDTVIIRKTPLHECKGILMLNNGRGRLEALDFQAFGGKVALEGDMDFSAQPYTYNGELNLMDTDAAEVIAHATSGAKEKSVLQGKISVNTDFTGQGFSFEDIEQYLWAQGTVDLRDGELTNIDILDAVSGVQGLLGMKQRSYGTTRFNDVSAHLLLDKGVISSSDIVLESNDVTVNASGTMALRGDINYLLDITLAPPLSKKVLSGLQENQTVSVPLQITGTVQKPRYKITGQLVNRVVDSLLKKGLEKMYKETSSKSQPAAEPKTDAITEESLPVEENTQLPISQSSETSTSSQEQKKPDDEIIEDAVKIGLNLLLGNN